MCRIAVVKLAGGILGEDAVAKREHEATRIATAAEDEDDRRAPVVKANRAEAAWRRATTRICCVLAASS
jgi:hypothetical protein